ncbi:hypothetical protein [Streptomyces sp. NPDC005435]|uniref:hypothetical protein n=1 Tax=Streptomyces sp. NPDC005435 TaxID=3154464 RepID=UPI00345125FA
MTVPTSLSDDLSIDLGSTAHLMGSIGTHLARQLRHVTPPGFVPSAEGGDVLPASARTGATVEQLSA